MNFIGIIPARYASTRFEGKPLCRIGGKTMIERTYNQAVKVKEFAEVIVATDDERIYNEVLSFGGKAVMTSENCCSGTDRCAEAFQQLDFSENDTVVVNIQGDEPFIKPEQIQELIRCFEFPPTRHAELVSASPTNETSPQPPPKEGEFSIPFGEGWGGVQIATLIKEIDSQEMLENPNIVKVVISNENKALYFSRCPIPFLRNITFAETVFYKHIGIYAYKAAVLAKLVKLPPSSLEKAESLEQLRWLQAGYSIYTQHTKYEASISIDTPEDLELVNNEK